MQERLIEIAQINQHRAHEIIQELNLIPLWASINVEAHLVGSLRMGLLMKHLDIDLHLYSDPVSLADDFRINPPYQTDRICQPARHRRGLPRMAPPL